MCSVSKSPNVSVTRLKRQSTVENHPKGPNKPQTELILFPMSLYAVFYVTVCRFMCHRFLCHGMPFSMSRFTVFYVTVYRFLCHGMPFSMSRYAVFYVTVYRFLSRWKRVEKNSRHYGSIAQADNRLGIGHIGHDTSEVATEGDIQVCYVRTTSAAAWRYLYDPAEARSPFLLQQKIGW